MERMTRGGFPERRNYTPPGRLRRIFHDYRRPVGAMLAAVFASVAVFAAIAVWAVEERFERRAAEIAFTHDTRSMEYVRRQEGERLAHLAAKAREQEQRVAELEPDDSPYLVVSIAERHVWYLQGDDTLYSAPVAVGSGETMVLGGKTKRFQTPRGMMRITHKERDPVWVPPSWHYIEYARKRNLRVVDYSNRPPNALAGFPAGRVPVANGTVYIPPWGSPQRRHTGVLGVAKLEMYDGYYFHGTDNEASVGTAASHGCLRMRRGDILWMYENVPVGTKVYIY